MAMTVTVTRSRKTSHNFNSDGCGLSLTVELDPGLLDRPDELRGRVEALYAELDRAIDAESQRSTVANLATAERGGHGVSTSTNGDGDDRFARDRHGRRDDRDRSRHHEDRRRGRSHGDGDEPGMTQSQRRAIHAIAKRLDVDPEDEAIGLADTSLDGLTLKQASALIDRLKAMQSANGRRRSGNGQAAVEGGVR